MSVAGISGSSVMYMGATSPSAGTTNSRQTADSDARELIVDLEKGDLSGAQSAYNNLASLGANNSGPWAQGSQMQQSFQQLGQDLASGNLAGARTDAKGMAKQQLSNDLQSIQSQSGNTSSYSQAVQNYKEDYWAIFGQAPTSNPSVQGGAGTSTTPSVLPGLSVTA